MNPKLIPALTSDKPNELLQRYCHTWCSDCNESTLIAYRSGVANEILAKNERGRGRKRSIHNQDKEERQPRKRSRSISSCSASSVSTISTAFSQRSRDSSRNGCDQYLTSQVVDSFSRSQGPTTYGRKRGRSSTSSASDTDNRLPQHSRARQLLPGDRNIRRRRQLTGPDERGRRRSRSVEYSDHTPRRVRDNSIKTRNPERDRTRLSPSAERLENTSPKRPEKSPKRREEVEQRHFANGNDYADEKSAGSRVQDTRRYRSRSPLKRDRDNSPIDGLAADDKLERRRPIQRGERNFRRDERKERSLSPYSKRIALTQAMNGGK